MDALLEQPEKHLCSNDWFGGSVLTSADILLSYSIESENARGYLTENHPNTQLWLKRIYQRSAFQSAKEKDGRESMVLAL
jgi:glutathione S-transferase